ncbi:hypothetical protein, partial [Escherichia coli]|uniref:hypothetical protein n=2 Tax=Escherichia coli TaxID=562 RepID=UPI001BDB7529
VSGNIGANPTTIARVLIFMLLSFKKLFLNRHGQSFCTLCFVNEFDCQHCTVFPQKMKHLGPF